MQFIAVGSPMKFENHSPQALEALAKLSTVMVGLGMLKPGYSITGLLLFDDPETGTWHFEGEAKPRL
jgi:hypothetical protein